MNGEVFPWKAPLLAKVLFKKKLYKPRAFLLIATILLETILTLRKPSVKEYKNGKNRMTP